MSLSEDVATVVELADLYHGRWRIEEAYKRLKHRLGLESVSGLSPHALLVDVAAKVLGDNLTALLNREVPMAPDSPDRVSRQVNRAAASKLFSRCIGSILLAASGIAQGVHNWITTLSRCWTRRIPVAQGPETPLTPSLILHSRTSVRLKFGGLPHAWLQRLLKAVRAMRRNVGGRGQLLPETQGQLHTVVAARTQQHRAHVVAHCVGTDAQLLPNGFVAHALGQKLQDMLFSVRESHAASSFVRDIAQGAT